ncbi:hypothetical protein C8Q77DRAFT_341541 [Trametes polyzona]|nr:hypothetical protein C8Q77DRAFT_341541 [Trametes polyzona]
MDYHLHSDMLQDSWQAPPEEPQEPIKPPARTDTLSPLHLQGMQQPFQDMGLPPTTPLYESGFPGSTPYANAPSLTPVTAHLSPFLVPTPSTSISHFPTSTYPNSPYEQAPHSYWPSPIQHGSLGFTNSPGPVSPSFYSAFGSPTPTVYYDALSSPSPATHVRSVYCTPAQAGPSSLPAVSQPSPYPRMAPALPMSPSTSAQRIPVEQTVEYVSKGRLSETEAFAVQGSLGVPVRGVLDGTVRVDGQNERVLERTGMRQIHFIIAWPGYRRSGTYINAQEEGAFITRGQLALRICEHISRFMKRAAKPPVAPKHAQWAIGPTGISVDQVWLLSIAPQAKKNKWVAELEVHR